MGEEEAVSFVDIVINVIQTQNYLRYLKEKKIISENDKSLFTGVIYLQQIF